MPRQQTTKVLVVGGSAVARRALTTYINSHNNLEVIGFATDLSIALRKLDTVTPDILTLDIHLINQENTELLEKLKAKGTLPILRIASNSTKNSTDNALVSGPSSPEFSFDPTDSSSDSVLATIAKLCDLLLTTANSSSAQKNARPVRPQQDHNRSTNVTASVSKAAQNSTLLLALGASTGGVNALKEVLMRLPAGTPGTVIVQHIPGTFSGPLAKKLDSCSAMQVKEAEHGETILQGHAYLAPGDRHLSVERKGSRFVCALSDDEPVNRHRPSVDVLFNSVAECAAKKSIGVILTGMGQDGAKGLLQLRTSGSPTIAQDEESSIVWGMPGSAVALEAADYILPLDKVAEGIRQLFALDKAA